MTIRVSGLEFRQLMLMDAARWTGDVHAHNRFRAWIQALIAW